MAARRVPSCMQPSVLLKSVSHAHCSAPQCAVSAAATWVREPTGQRAIRKHYICVNFKIYNVRLPSTFGLVSN